MVLYIEILWELDGIDEIIKMKSFWRATRSPNITLTTYFYKDIYQKVIYVNFCEIIFQDKSIHDLYSQCLTRVLSKTTSFFSTKGVAYF